jgi:5-methyltetrahydrofolate--homocysteine methyltransferase
MIPFREILKSGKPLLADGAVGSLLIANGLAAGACPELFNIEHPDVIRQINEAYIEAGADIFQTNTFGASPLKLQHYKLDGKAEELNRAAVRIAKEARKGKEVYIYGSCGPSGRLLKPFGDTEPEAMFDSIKIQAAALIDEGVDLLVFETMTDLNEARLAIQAARSVSKDIPIAATMTFDKTPRGYFTIMGVTIAQAADGLAEAGADIIGSNCGNGIEKMIEIAAEFKKQTDKPVIIQSNAGLPVMKDGQITYSETPEFMKEKTAELLGLGVRIIGGCCGTTPEHILAFRNLIDER